MEIVNYQLIKEGKLTPDAVLMIEYIEDKLRTTGIPMNPGTKSYVAFVHKLREVSQMTPETFIKQHPHRS